MVHPVVGHTGISRRGICMAAPPPAQNWDLWDPAWGPSEDGLYFSKHWPVVEETDPEEVLSSIHNPRNIASRP